MKTKDLGTRHGQATRARLEAVASSVEGVRSKGVRYGRQAVDYVAGFARGLLRPRNAYPNA